MDNIDFIDAHHVAGGFRTTRVGSTSRKPRLPGDGCGCTRSEEEYVGDEKFYVVTLCERHSLERNIAHFMLG